MMPFIFLALSALYSWFPSTGTACLYVGGLIGVWIIYTGLLVSVTLGKNEIHRDVIDYGVNIPTTIVYFLVFVPGVMATGGMKWFTLFVFAIYFLASFLLAKLSHVYEGSRGV